MSPVAPTPTQAEDPAGDSRDDGVTGMAAASERLRAARDRAICGAHRHGVPIAAIARMMEMSDRRVSEIVGDPTTP